MKGKDYEKVGNAETVLLDQIKSVVRKQKIKIHYYC